MAPLSPEVLAELNVLISVTVSPFLFTLSLMFCFSPQKWKQKDVCYLSFVPGCDSNFDKCTVTMDQSNSDQLHTHRHLHTHTHIDAHTHRCKHTSIQTHTRRHVYTHPPLYQSAIGLSWFPVQQPDQWAWSCSPIVPQIVFFLPAQSHVGQQGQTFKDNSVPLLYIIPFVCISMENEQEREPVPVPPPSPPDMFIHPSVCPPPLLPPPHPVPQQTDRRLSTTPVLKVAWWTLSR